MDEPVELLAGRVDRVAHAHLADTPGRHEPGTGRLDWRMRIEWLETAGYKGLIGLEYTPLAESAASVAFPSVG